MRAVLDTELSLASVARDDEVVIALKVDSVFGHPITSSVRLHRTS
jgi:hypothetical protein